MGLLRNTPSAQCSTCLILPATLKLRLQDRLRIAINCTSRVFRNSPKIQMFKRWSLKYWQPLLLIMVASSTLLIHLGLPQVSELMEARNLQTAREIVRDGSWLLPTMNGELRLAKPPLPTWLTGIAAIAGGGFENLTVLRVPSAIAAMIMVLALYGVCVQLTQNKQWALFAGLILATSVQWIEIGRQNFWDIYVHASMLSAIWCFLKAIKAQEKKYWWGFSITMGISLLCKGPVGFFSLMSPFVVAWCITMGGVGQLKKYWKPIAAAFGLALLIGIAWPVVVYLTNLNAGLHTLNREVSSWTDAHVYPWWFYSHFLILTGIWMTFGWSILNIPMIRRRLDGERKLGKFLLTWVGITFVLLSIMPHKQMRYLLPIWVPVDMIIAGIWVSIIQTHLKHQLHKQNQRLLLIHLIIVTIFSTAATGVICKAIVNHIMTMRSGIVGIMMIWVATGMTIQFFKNKNPKAILFSTVAVVVAVMIGGYPALVDPLKGNYDYTVLSALKNDTTLKDIPFYTTLPRIEMQYVFYAGKEIKLWEVNGATQFPVNPPLIILTIDKPLDLSQYKGDMRHIKLKELTHYPSKKGGQKIWIPTLIINTMENRDESKN